MNKMERFILLLLVLAGVILFSFDVSARHSEKSPIESSEVGWCLKRPLAVDLVVNVYGEIKVAQGLTSSGALLEVYFNPESEAWSLLATNKQDISCLMGVGDHWMMVPTLPPPEIKGEDS